jgi:3-deoxy-manno-octulosonate cytidylyltransferase (CMP-KDO synthetase)
MVCDLKQIPVIMTSQLHPDCIDRVAEVLYQFENKRVGYDRYIIIQGDEPMFNPQMLDVDLSPPVVNFFTAADGDMDDPNAVKVVVSNGNRAIYFSRFSLPYSEVITRKSSLTPRVVWKQLGTYSFSPAMLKIYTTLKPSPLENAEGIGLNRLIENDIPIIMRHSIYDSTSVDTPEDLDRVRKLIQNQPVLDGRN